MKAAYLDFDGHGVFAAITPVPAVRTVKRRDESPLRACLLLPFPIAGELIARIRPFTMHVEVDLAARGGPHKDELLALSHGRFDFRTLIGATNPAQAAEGTIRKKYAKSIEANAVHGSDSDENAQIEADFFFGAK